MRARVGKMARDRQNRRTGFKPVSIFSPSAFIRVHPRFGAHETIKLPNEPILENEHSPMNTDVFALFSKPPNEKRTHLSRTLAVGYGEHTPPACGLRRLAPNLVTPTSLITRNSAECPKTNFVADQSQSRLLNARNFFSEQQSRKSRVKMPSRNSCSFVSIPASHRRRETTKSANSSAICGEAGYNSSLTLTPSIGKVCASILRAKP